MNLTLHRFPQVLYCLELEDDSTVDYDIRSEVTDDVTAKVHEYVPFALVRDLILAQVDLRGVVIYAFAVAGAQFGVYLFDHFFDVHQFFCGFFTGSFILGYDR